MSGSSSAARGPDPPVSSSFPGPSRTGVLQLISQPGPVIAFPDLFSERPWPHRKFNCENLITFFPGTKNHTTLSRLVLLHFNKLHWFPVTDEFTAARLAHENNIPADIAPVHFTRFLNIDHAVTILPFTGVRFWYRIHPVIGFGSFQKPEPELLVCLPEPSEYRSSKPELGPGPVPDGPAGSMFTVRPFPVIRQAGPAALSRWRIPRNRSPVPR